MIALTWSVTVLVFLVVLFIGTQRFRRRPVYWSGSNTDEFSAQWLIDHIKKAKESVNILAGGLEPHVYDQVAGVVADYLQSNPKLKIKIISGPAILATDDGNKLFELSRKGFNNRLQIACLDRTPLNHFRVVDSTHLFVEDTHEFGSSSRTVSILEGSVFKGWQYNRKFEMIWQRQPRACAPRLVNVS